MFPEIFNYLKKYTFLRNYKTFKIDFQYITYLFSTMYCIVPFNILMFAKSKNK